MDQCTDGARERGNGQVSFVMAAMQQAVPLGQKAHQVVMAAWLVQLRSQLLPSGEVPANGLLSKEGSCLHVQTRELL